MLWNVLAAVGALGLNDKLFFDGWGLDDSDSVFVKCVVKYDQRPSGGAAAVIVRRVTLNSLGHLDPLASARELVTINT